MYILAGPAQEDKDWQNLPVGSVWTNGSVEIRVEAVEPVSVPAGVFADCIKFKKHELGAAEEDAWYEWVKPGLLMVKWVDYSCSNPGAEPVVYELLGWQDAQ